MRRLGTPNASCHSEVLPPPRDFPADPGASGDPRWLDGQADTASCAPAFVHRCLWPGQVWTTPESAPRDSPSAFPPTRKLGSKQPSVLWKKGPGSQGFPQLPRNTPAWGKDVFWSVDITLADEASPPHSCGISMGQGDTSRGPSLRRIFVEWVDHACCRRRWMEEMRE